MTFPIPPQCIELARAAMLAELRSDPAGVGQVLAELAATPDGEGVFAAMHAWCDLAAAAVGLRPAPGQQVEVGFVAVNGDRGTEPPAEVVWAGQLYAARLTGDRARFMALLDELPSNEHTVSWVRALLACMSAMVAHAPAARAEGRRRAEKGRRHTDARRAIAGLHGRVGGTR